MKEELYKTMATEYVQIFENETVGWSGDYKPDLCVIDHKNSKAFIIEISNPFDTFIEDCYNFKFHKYMQLCFNLCDTGFDTKTVVLVIGSLGTVHRRVVPGLSLLGLSTKQSKYLARYLSVSAMIGSRRAWARRGCRLSGHSRLQ